MKIADLQYREIVEGLRQVRGLDEIMLQYNLGSVTPAAPIEPADHEKRLDHGLAERHIKKFMPCPKTCAS